MCPAHSVRPARVLAFIIIKIVTAILFAFLLRSILCEFRRWLLQFWRICGDCVQHGRNCWKNSWPGGKGTKGCIQGMFPYSNITFDFDPLYTLIYQSNQTDVWVNIKYQQLLHHKFEQLFDLNKPEPKFSINETKT